MTQKISTPQIYNNSLNIQNISKEKSTKKENFIKRVFFRSKFVLTDKSDTKETFVGQSYRKFLTYASIYKKKIIFFILLFYFRFFLTLQCRS